MKIKIRIDKENIDAYVLQTNHIPRRKEYIEIGEHKYRVTDVQYFADYTDTEIKDVIINVNTIY